MDPKARAGGAPAIQTPSRCTVTFAKGNTAVMLSERPPEVSAVFGQDAPLSCFVVLAVIPERTPGRYRIEFAGEPPAPGTTVEMLLGHKEASIRFASAM